MRKLNNEQFQCFDGILFMKAMTLARTNISVKKGNLNCFFYNFLRFRLRGMAFLNKLNRNVL